MGNKPILSNLLGLGRMADCKNCEVPIAEDTNQSHRWRAMSNPPSANNRNTDGSRNLDGKVCDTSRTGKHQPRDGSLR